MGKKSCRVHVARNLWQTFGGIENTEEFLRGGLLENGL
jgi:hypothetical protein